MGARKGPEGEGFSRGRAGTQRVFSRGSPSLGLVFLLFLRCALCRVPLLPSVVDSSPNAFSFSPEAWWRRAGGCKGRWKCERWGK